MTHPATILAEADATEILITVFAILAWVVGMFVKSKKDQQQREQQRKDVQAPRRGSSQTHSREAARGQEESASPTSSGAPGDLARELQKLFGMNVQKQKPPAVPPQHSQRPEPIRRARPPAAARQAQHKAGRRTPLPTSPPMPSAPKPPVEPLAAALAIEPEEQPGVGIDLFDINEARRAVIHKVILSPPKALSPEGSEIYDR